jgi:uncharacterized protein (DUF1501 family)
MFNRRQFLKGSLAGASLLATGSLIPGFLAKTAFAAEHGKDTILVVLEMTGGNDGLNTVIPYADDLYVKNRPTLKYGKTEVVKVDDNIGLNPGMVGLRQMVTDGQVACVQGVGYPNGDRSHFESMDIWHSCDLTRKTTTGWIGRSVVDLQDKKGNVPVVQIGPNRLPLALQGGHGGVVSINNKEPYKLELGTDEKQKAARRKLMEDLAKPAEAAAKETNLLDFVQKRQVQTYVTLDKLQDVMKDQQSQANQFLFGNQSGQQYQPGKLPQRMMLISRLIQKELGTRVFYTTIDGFDTHSDQKEPHRLLLAEVADAIEMLFTSLKQAGGGHEKRVLVMTYSEFGRRVLENGSRGTDHGAGSCMFVVGPGVKGGAVGKHPKIDDLDQGDLKFHTDFRQVYATLLDQWLKVDSRAVLGNKFEHIDLMKG